MKFQVTIQAAGKTATGIRIPAQVVDSLGAGKKPPVRVTINGATYRSTIASRSGQYLVGVSAENRELTGVAAGDEVEVDIELDTEPREVEVPPDLAAALDGEPDAKRFFESLTHSQKQGFVQPIEQAKKPETRERRVEKTLAMLRARAGSAESQLRLALLDAHAVDADTEEELIVDLGEAQTHAPPDELGDVRAHLEPIAAGVIADLGAVDALQDVAVIHRAQGRRRLHHVDPELLVRRVLAVPR